MKKFYTAIAAGSLTLALTACGTSDEEGTDESAGDAPEETEETGDEDDDEAAQDGEAQSLVVGASNVPHAEILEYATDLLEEEGIELEIQTFNDYVMPNQALDLDELDANYFQHIPYLESQIEEHGYDFENVGGVHIEPMGGYSQEYASLADLPEDAHVIMSDSVADHGRVLSLFEAEGLITIADGIDPIYATIDDIDENPNNFDFDPSYEAALLPQAFDVGEGDVVFINSNYAIDNDLNPVDDSIVVESGEDNPYVNVIAVKAENQDDENIQTLVDILQSDDVKQFIEDQYEGAVLPAE
ncbi:MetQ/NlpA family ABC transporter substrate-binding protein [Geomicrobium sp. JCM 19039]|uniref:MetQ/NlpA family ABC transporter substrate-binding protein n=1 Tax=Geomicrobium sp. JCM 19039 TaxID=1460636 RepID=UPI00045F4B80|nr:MetQ/NlpA family ABC transporter substrate-binding protein [Geomicrobium sp. JCM 19039]GAK13994.1 methionine ABC transporter substrate-binding protein [Geomicrobium sp. JCM 19039]